MLAFISSKKRRKIVNNKIAGLVASIIVTDEDERKVPIPYHNQFVQVTYTIMRY
jgi:hypothetical protein